ncbi:MAG: hypothetical protein KKB21_04735 [Nanoarchaeota archaeon]|nr:hypothetical protein [Nanoarchaeota archaeon]MBU4086852.1 hypothetical protein [Nanoarchaeota archaeon]
MKVIIFDSSTIINFTMNGLLDVFRELRRNFQGKFIIPRSVKYETIDRPLNIKQFELGALSIQRLLEEKVIELPEAVQVKDEEIIIRTRELLKRANKVFLARNEFMHIIDEGEASCLALSQILSERGIRNVIAVDERTTRMLGEVPENLRKLFEKKFHTEVKMFKQEMPGLENIKFIRSSELVYVAWKKGLVKMKSSKVLDALLYATKFKGSSISHEEIEEIKHL